MRVTGSPCGHSQGPQGSAPGNELIEHLVNGFLMVRGRLELCVILEVGDQRECDLIADRRVALGRRQILRTVGEGAQPPHDIWRQVEDEGAADLLRAGFPMGVMR